jgi:hypothetical protein
VESPFSLTVKTPTTPSKFAQGETQLESFPSFHLFGMRVSPKQKLGNSPTPQDWMLQKNPPPPAFPLA